MTAGNVRDYHAAVRWNGSVMSEPQPPPTPVTPLNYSHALGYHGRPGILTAVGVMSIVVACLSGLTSLSGAFGAGMYYWMSKQPPAVFAPVPLPAPATGPTTTPAVAGGGIVQMNVTTYGYTAGLPGTGATATTAPTTAPGAAAAPPPAAMGNPFGEINPLAALLSCLAELLSLALAILLLVAGIQTLRDAASAAKLHRWFAVMKIPLVIAGAGVGYWMSSGMMKGILASTPGGATGPGGAANFALTSGFMIVSAVAGAMFALAYPVALLIVLRSRAVREFYNRVRGGDAAPLPESFDTPVRQADYERG